MTKSRTSLMLIVLSVTLVASLSVGLLQESEATKGQGVGLTETGSNKVCGDRLCSEPATSSSSHIETPVQTILSNISSSTIFTLHIFDNIQIESPCSVIFGNSIFQIAQ